jgi:cysteine synthase A
MGGGEPGAHAIQGIGDGFIPDLVDMAFVDGVEAVSTADAKAASQRIHDEHGYCVGMSAGANMVAALRLRDLGLKVATLWPDCSDRYVSMGLVPPSAEGQSCPLSARCAARWQDVIDA